jgi:hypothetical protein
MLFLRNSVLSLVICSNINALKPAPNLLFKYLSYGFVRKKFIRLWELPALA